MVNLEQIRLLESRVQKAIKYIQKLREENRSLRASLEKYEQRIGDLEGMVGDFKNGQDEIEVSITNALKQLDRLEDELIEEPDEAGSKSPRKAGAEHPAASPADSVRTEHTKTQPAKTTQPSQQSDEDFEAESVEADANAKEDKEDAESELDIF